jgi:diadenosine tetraphosphate (Ap4A) HIT family hydrolase
MNNYCPFCIITKEQRTLKEGTFAYVIFSNPRLMPGHLLVIPKRHVTRINQFTKEEKDEIFSMLIEFQDKILSKLASGCDIRQNFKPYVKNSRTHVDHVHFHLLPREFEDELQMKVEQHKDSLYKDLSDEEKNNITELLG